MVESSKILTVSYGTFSCTLEGFDDSFATMKAIAEYFRDLAAGDRYFGAEPPTPDADMLAHIAQRETARRVEAHSGENGIVLRAAAALAPSISPMAADATMAEDKSDTVAAVDDHVSVAAEPVLAAQSPDPERAPQQNTAHDIADTAGPDAAMDETSLPDVSMIAESVAHDAAEAAKAMPPQTQRPADAPVAAELAAAETSYDLPEVSAATDATAQTPDAPEEETPPLLVVSEPVAQAEAETIAEVHEPVDVTFVPTSSFADMQTSALATPTAVPAHPDADSVAAKLERIRAVVGKTPELAGDDGWSDDGYAEDLPSDDQTNHDSIAAVLATVDQDAEFEDDETAISADFDNDKGIEDIADDVEDTFDDGFDAAENIDVALTDAHDLMIEDIADDDTFDIESGVDDQTETAMDADDVSAAVAEVEPEAAIEPVADEPVKKPTLRARILRVGRPKAATAPPVADIPEMPEVAEAPQPAPLDLADEDLDLGMASLDGGDDLTDFSAAVDATLSPEDEADLQRELDDLSLDAPQPRTDKPGRDALPMADDAAMSRIMDQADEELSNPEGNRRRNAIAQLKAAVAATEAARQLGDDTDTAAAAEEEFRDDLEQVVRPRRAARTATGEARSERPRPAPLKLVASQRVDVQTAAPNADPVRPRRVAAAEPTTPTDASSFAEFAETMGATELPDLLEAAAAYTAYVEGIEDFSRPQIMKKVQLTVSESFSREDGLRSFGTLLRQGRISKVRNGRFQVSDQTRFKPEQRVAQG